MELDSQVPAPTLSDYEALKREVEALRAENASLKEGSKRKHKMVKTTLSSKMSHHVVSHQGKIGRRHMRGTASSMASAEILAGLFTPRETVPEKILSRLDDSANHTSYFRGKQFALELMKLCEDAQNIFEQEPRCLNIQSPCHVFGDIHGNLDDLHFFGENVWNKGMSLTPGRLLFLGDYVDRGMYSLECVAYILSMKILAPKKVFLLRGNHELRDVNSWEDYYGEGSFLWQCKDRFGVERGAYLWEVVNQMFDRLPLAAVIDHDIFCIHGGIPRPRKGAGQIEIILRVPEVAAVSPPYPCEDPDLTRVAYECLWSDPAKPSDEAHMDPTGYGANPRGSTAQCFGKAAVEEFLDHYDMSYIIRAHEKTAEGITVSKGGRVLTVFSTSKDHHLGEMAMSACLLVDDGKIEVITKDPSYVSRMERQRLKKGSQTPMADSIFNFVDNSKGIRITPQTPHSIKEAPLHEEDVYFRPGSGQKRSPDASEDEEDGETDTGAISDGNHNNRPTKLDLDDGSVKENIGCVPPLESPGTFAANMNRRDSLDVGLFKQLRAQAPQVVLQPSQEQRKEFRSSDTPLRRTHSISEESSSSEDGNFEPPSSVRRVPHHARQYSDGGSSEAGSCSEESGGAKLPTQNAN
eukprot:CAMPEP_0171458128 /NCGR_PEP_ID=MMETSP0945-20130129/3933_1 /TAXON_ID=109269 /ORGANISM="Vaucheria litorea, Strain CCMP2940" /LENGTH=634 /DNA_ID=CAMNT_0011983879 /DNA_START=83 /DNA_END=1987 /DNA_ORIENTATION=-